LKKLFSWVLAAAAFVLIYFFRVPFPLIVAGAGLAGWLATLNTPVAQREIVPTPREGVPGAGWRRALKVTAISLLVWWLPVGLLWATVGNGTLVREGIFFSKTAMVTFGGAYAVLPYVGQQASEHYGWLSAAQMLDGLGLAETTPGPLIMVVQFVGFLGAWNQPGPLRPLVSATLGALITTWTTFVPCFLWILLGAPYLERLRHHARIAGALAAVTAAVVGVVLNLAVWFGVQTFRPAAGWDGFAVAVGCAAFVALQRYKVSVVGTVIASGAMGLVWMLVHRG
jgi:chromate transporter